MRNLIAAVCMALAACNESENASYEAERAQAAEPAASLRAADLIMRHSSEGSVFDWSLPAGLARYPETVPLLRKRAEKEVAECREQGSCMEEVSYSIVFDGKRLLNLQRASFRSGGAHTNSDSEDWVYDKATQQPIRFGDIFRSWNEARPVLQRKWCAALMQWRIEQFERRDGDCPPIEKMTLLLADGSEGALSALGGPANEIQVVIDSYDTAPFASAESGELWMDMDTEILKLVRPEYRDDIAVKE